LRALLVSSEVDVQSIVFLRKRWSPARNMMCGAFLLFSFSWLIKSLLTWKLSITLPQHS
jgi:hypothetical protein